MLNDNSINKILEAAMSKTADFAEVFIEQSESSSISLLNGRVHRAGKGIASGIGIRLMADTNVVYVYSNDFDTDVLIKLALDAADALKGNDKGSIRELQEKCYTTSSKLLIDPSSVKRSDTADLLKQASSYAMGYDPLISKTMGSYTNTNRHVRIVNTEGVNCEKDTNRTRISFTVVAAKDNEMQTGSISPGTQRGYEFINEYPMMDKATECCDRALRMLSAGYAPSGVMPVVLGNGFGGVIFHEACGHSLEATAVGIKSSCFTDMLGKRIASPVVTAYDSARIEGEWGSYMTDDEGNTSSDLLLIENGILKNYLVDKLGSRRMNCKPTGCGRRQDYSYAPTSRMSNTFIAAGKDDPKDIIKDTEYGIYCSQMGGGSVDTTTGEFNFAVNEGYMIRNGQIKEPVRGATLIGKGAEVLLNIDRVGNDLELAAGACGSISGNVPVTVGQPTIRVSSMIVGGRDNGEE